MAEIKKALSADIFQAALVKINDRIKEQAAAVSAPIASATVPGIVKPGTNTTVGADGSLNVNTATATTAGVMKAGTGLKAASGTVSVDPDKIAEKTYVDSKITEIVGGAPETLDTLKEIADALGEDANLSATLTAEIGKKANTADVYTKTEVDEEFLKVEDYQFATEAEILAICAETLK